MVRPTKQKESKWSTHDLACTPCREKKIRCGRERPQCGACKKEGLECGYSTPGKRVNHVKLLCHNFKELEDRLSNIEGEISNVAIALGRKSSTDSGDELHNQSSDASENESVRSSGSRDYKYDFSETRLGPCTLYSLCEEFSNVATNATAPLKSHQHGSQNGMAEAIRAQLSHICSEASVRDSLELGADRSPIRLPPKQFLWMTQSYFFQHLDFTTDIFVQSSFLANAERIYSKPFEPKDEVWAICFNMVILLVLSSENPNCGADAFGGTQFVRPFLETVRSALCNAPLLIGARIVNAQALALLSIAAEKYYPAGVSESIFAQACLLVRKIGLQRMQSASTNSHTDEEEEHMKLVRSLYLRDKNTAITRGSNCWLPAFDNSVSSVLSQQNAVEPGYTARMALASAQEQIYRLHHSTESQGQSSSRSRNALVRIHRELESWVETHGLFSQQLAAPQEVKLKLDFFATRICAFRENPDTNNVQSALRDARLSCLLLLSVFHVNDKTLVNKLEQLLSSQSPNISIDAIMSSDSSKTQNEPVSDKSSENVPHWFHSALDSFSVPGFFMLLENIIQPESDGFETQAQEDLYLLQMISSCYKAVNSKSSIENYNQKVGRLMERILDVVRLLKNPTTQLQTPPYELDLSFPPTDPTMVSPQIMDQQTIPDFFDPGAFSLESMAAMSWDGFSATSPSTSGPPMVGSPSDFFSQAVPFNKSQPVPDLQDTSGQPRRKRRHLDSSEDILWADHMMEPCL